MEYVPRTVDILYIHFKMRQFKVITLDRNNTIPVLKVVNIPSVYNVPCVHKIKGFRKIAI